MKEKEKEKGVVVVAVDKDKASRHALKWAVDHILYKTNDTLILAHVRLIFPMSFSHLYPRKSNLVEREPDDQEMEMFRPFRFFCMRRKIKFSVVVLEDYDVAQALVDYAIRHRVENLLLGASSRNGLFRRLFEQQQGSSCIQNTVLKWIPDFCNVYVISKLGKLCGLRNACRQLPTIPFPQQQVHEHQTSSSYDHNNHILSDGILIPELADHHYQHRIDELSLLSPQINPTTDALFFSLPAITSTSSCTLDDQYDFQIDHHSLHHQFSSISHPNHHCVRTSLFLTHKLEFMEKEIKRLKLEHKQTMEMYHVACKEALAAKHKATDLHQLNMEKERRKQVAKDIETTMEKAIAIDQPQVSNKWFLQQTANSSAGEVKNKKKKASDSLDCCHTHLKYQSLFHMLAALLLPHFYFSIFI